ncbi:CoA transferase [Savagea sp. SN6]|uniref:CoA transferase n=1 Tax=Savagea serpentis TaxID=2785297 RepID=A0A8J7GL56_9BACL|nr:CoA transferase [Savagea serpentis]MBF4500918.1 CoA transferase [Savagea serpentis]
MKKALEGVKILDFSRVLAGPYCTMLLADMGAEVIKVERPGSGDDSRHFGPYQKGESAYYSLLNRGKKSIEINLKDEQDLEIIRNLIREVDIVVENYRPGIMEKFGLDYDSVKALNPNIIYTSISGFGQNGPYKERPAYDLVAQAMGGMMSITGYEHTPPTRTGSSLGDMSAALFATYGTLVALFHKERTGEGQFVDVAMMDSIVAMLETNVLQNTVAGINPGRVGSRHPLSTPFDAYRVKDGYIVIAIANNPLFEKLCHIMEQPELIEDERFTTDELRTSHEQELKVIIENFLSSYTVEEAESMLLDAGLPASRIQSIEEVVQDEQMKVREMLVDIEHPIAGKMTLVGNPAKLSATPADPSNAPPMLGEHNTVFKK